MMGLARLPLSRVPGLQFWKLCGSGTGEGFTPKPNTSVYAALCVWESREAAEAALATRFPFTWYRNNTAETCTLFLRPTSARGAWAGVAPFQVAEDARPDRSVVALTRATIKPRILMQFWRRVPDISQVIGANTDVRLKIGLGEVPLLHQITFSIWPDTQAMARFARAPGPHAAAIKAVRDGRWFREELYARFDLIDARGQWQNTDPSSWAKGASALTTDTTQDFQTT